MHDDEVGFSILRDKDVSGETTSRVILKRTTDTLMVRMILLLFSLFVSSNHVI
jgi:hypothetical protein